MSSLRRGTMFIFSVPFQFYGTAWPTCQPLRHGEGVRRGAACGVNVVLLRHLVVQVQQHGVHAVEGIHSRGRWAAEIQGVHTKTKKTNKQNPGKERPLNKIRQIRAGLQVWVLKVEANLFKISSIMESNNN